MQNDTGGSKASSLVKLATNIFLACFDVDSLMNEDRQYVRAQVSVTLLISHLSSFLLMHVNWKLHKPFSFSLMYVETEGVSILDRQLLI